jgi:hypothetical protein
MRIKRFAAASVLVSVAMVTALAQVPVQTKINFTVGTPFELKKGSGFVLPPGRYVLFQFETNNPNLFALYREDMTRPPVAMIETVPVYYDLGRLPGDTRIVFETEEASPGSYPVLEGWNVPGDYGWQVIRTATRGGGLSAKYEAGR